MSDKKTEFELTSYDPVELTIAPFSIDESLVDGEVERMLQQFTDYQPVDAPKGYEVKPGDYVEVAIKAFEDGKELKGLTTDGRTYAVGAGEMPEGFDSNIVGMKVGETKSFSFMGPSFDENMNPCDQQVDAEVTIKALQEEVKAELSDSWVKQYFPAFEGVSGMRDAIRANIEKQARSSYDMQLRQAVARELSGRLEGPIPDEAYEQMMGQLRAGIEMDLKSQGKTWDEFAEENGGEGQMRMMLLMQARDILGQQYALDAVFRHFDLKLEDDDLDKACLSMNPQANPQMLREQIEASGHGDILRELAERNKANEFALQQAKIDYVQ